MSIFLPVQSFLNHCFFTLRNRLKWSRAGYEEIPAVSLTDLSEEQTQRIARLSQKYQINFETHLNRTNALENYHFLDLLDEASKRFSWQPKPKQVLLDIGSQNFYYASVLNRFFQPQKLTGIEVDGYVIYQDWYSRFDYAQFHIKDFQNTNYWVGDFCQFKGSSQSIICFYPFVTKTPLLKWALPLRLLKPNQFFEKVFETMASDGFFFMVNHGEEESQLACELAAQSGLICKNQFVWESPLLFRHENPVVSLWGKN